MTPISTQKPMDVVVTGFGAVTPLGQDAETSWKSLLEGKSAQTRLNLFDTSGCRCHDAATAELPPLPSFTPKQLSRFSRASRLALPAAKEALAHAGLLDERGLSRIANLPMSVSTTGGGMALGEFFFRRTLEKRQCRRLGAIARYQPQQQVLDLQRYLGFGGSSMITANACASGANAIGIAAGLIRSGFCECVLTGGFEALTELIFVGFDCLQATSPDRCRPFDMHRSGLILGEGAAFMVLESKSHAIRRGAQIRCELAGYGATTDLHHLTQPSPDGRALVHAMQEACQESGISPSHIGYLNAHGTATPINDRAEIEAMRTFFGRDPVQLRLSSTKAAIGHTLGAAGSIEAVFTMQTLLSGDLPPQINLQQPEIGISENLVRSGEKRTGMQATMSVNLGFGGSNAALIFRKTQ